MAMAMGLAIRMMIGRLCGWGKERQGWCRAGDRDDDGMAVARRCAWRCAWRLCSDRLAIAKGLGPQLVRSHNGV